jgi:hypothetical protein
MDLLAAPELHVARAYSTLGRHGGAAHSPAGADLTGMANLNVPMENPDAPSGRRR